jgi:hypothetical protein
MRYISHDTNPLFLAVRGSVVAYGRASTRSYEFLQHSRSSPARARWSILASAGFDLDLLRDGAADGDYLIIDTK